MRMPHKTKPDMPRPRVGSALGKHRTQNGSVPRIIITSRSSRRLSDTRLDIVTSNDVRRSFELRDVGPQKVQKVCLTVL